MPYGVLWGYGELLLLLSHDLSERGRVLLRLPVLGLRLRLQLWGCGLHRFSFRWFHLRLQFDLREGRVLHLQLERVRLRDPAGHECRMQLGG
jgi:hypothetical protein